MKKQKLSFWTTIDTLKLKEVVIESNSFADVLRYFDFPKNGSNYKPLKKRIEKEGIEISHFTTHSSSPCNNEDLFKSNSKASTSVLKNRILKHKLKDYKCSICNLDNHWNGKRITLQLDHINGVTSDNRLENLRFLCPNCHSQTDTFGARNHKERKETLKKKSIRNCSDCNKKIHNKQRGCTSCLKKINIQKNKFIIETSNLKELIQTENLTDIAKRFGVTSNTVKKRCKKLGIWNLYKEPREAKKKEMLEKQVAQQEKNKEILKRYQDISRLDKEGFSVKQICEKTTLSPRRVREIILDIKRNKIKI